MECATEKQIITLKRFAKSPKLNQGILKGVEFHKLSNEKASELIKKCISESGWEDAEEDDCGDFTIKYSQNYKNGNGAFATIILSNEELESVRRAHREHCAEIMAECEEDYPNDKDLQLSMFNQRSDKVFTWIQNALEEKVRNKRQ